MRAQQIDPGRENVALAGQHHRFGARIAQLAKGRPQRVGELGVHGVGLAMRHGDDRDLALMTDFDHWSCSGGGLS